MLKKLFVFLLLFFIQFQCFCYTGTVIIKGYIPGCVPGETVQLRTFKYYFQRRWDEDGVLTTARVENGRFSFTIPAKESGYVSIFFPVKYLTKNLVLFLAEPGDNIAMKISEEGILFSGKGSAKYTCQYKMSTLPGISWNPAELKSLEGIKGYNYLSKCKEKYDSLFGSKARILTAYETHITPLSLRRIMTDIEAERLFTLYTSFGFWLNYPAGEEERLQQLEFYSSHYLKKFPVIRNQRLAAHSKFYTDWMIQKIKLDLLVKNYFKGDKLPLTDIVPVIKKTFSGILREKLLITAFIQFPPVEKSGIACLKDAGIMIREPYFKKLFRHCEEKIPRARVYNFTLVDENGKEVKPDDFKNKVVVVDFWITGCSFSKDAKEGLKEIKKTFAGNTGFVFLSVSADKSRDNWLESLKDSSYNIKGDINLYTAGLGSDHPLLKKYDYQSFPQILIIDKNQKVFSIQPPMPGSPDRNKAFVSLLKGVSR